MVDRGGQGVFQHRQLQLPHGHHSRPQHEPRVPAQENGVIYFILLFFIIINIYLIFISLSMCVFLFRKRYDLCIFKCS